MDYNEILKEAAGLMGPYCKACPVCNGRACGNCVPGPGSKLPGNTAARNYDKWQEIFVNMDTLNPNANVDTSFELFGKKFSAPVFIAPLGALPLHYGDKYDDITYNRVLINAAANYGICAMTGDGEFPQLIPDAVDEMSKIGGIGIPTIKPWNKEVVFEKLDYVKAHNVFAVAMDVDGAGLPFLKKLSPNAGSKSVDEMREIIDYAGKPFIIKGIMTVKGAEKAVEAGEAPSSFQTTAAEFRAAPRQRRRSCRLSRRQSRARSRSLLTAAYAAALTCSRPSVWARTRCSSAVPSFPSSTPRARRASRSIWTE